LFIGIHFRPKILLFKETTNNEIIDPKQAQNDGGDDGRQRGAVREDIFVFFCQYRDAMQ